MRVGFNASFKQRAMLVGLAIVVLALVVVPVASAASGSMALAGLVYGHCYNGNKALGGAVVDVYPANADPSTATPIASTTTVSSGLYQLVVSLGTPSTYAGYPIYAKKSNFSTGTSAFDFVPSTPTNLSTAIVPDIVLNVLTTKVTGTVKDAKSKKPIKGVSVVIPGAKKVKTNSKGKYSVTTALWPNSSYKASFSKKGFKSKKSSFKSAPGASKTVNVSLKKS